MALWNRTVKRMGNLSKQSNVVAFTIHLPEILRRRFKGAAAIAGMEYWEYLEYLLDSEQNLLDDNEGELSNDENE